MPNDCEWGMGLDFRDSFGRVTVNLFYAIQIQNKNWNISRLNARTFCLERLEQSLQRT